MGSIEHGFEPVLTWIALQNEEKPYRGFSRMNADRQGKTLPLMTLIAQIFVVFESV